MSQPEQEREDVKRAVRERDGFCCTSCGVTNDESRDRFGRGLDVHRRVPGSLYTVDGCVTLCTSCHGPQPRRESGQPDEAYGDAFDNPKHRDEVPGFGAAVRSRRQARGLTLAQLASESGFHFTYISGIERGRKHPSLFCAASLASALGVTVDVLLMDAARLAPKDVKADPA